MEEMKLIVKLSELLAGSISTDEQKVRKEFKELCEESGFIVKGKGVDLNAISGKAGELIKSIANSVESGEELALKPHLETIGTLLGYNIIDADPEEGNEDTQAN